MSSFDINTCTVQEACDYAMKKIVAQGEPCISSTNHCMYGNIKGQHCAIGWLLDPNNKELMAFSGDIEAMLDLLYVEPIPTLIKENVDVFITLQKLHDCASHVDDDEDALKAEVDELLGKLTAAGISTTKPHWQQWKTIIFS